MSVPYEIADFIILPVELRTKILPPTTHYIYLKSYDPRTPTPDSTRSIFLVNIPVTTTEAHLRDLFRSQLGTSHIQHIYFADRYGLDPATTNSLIASTPSAQRTQPDKEVAQTTGKRKRQNEVSSEAIKQKLLEYGLPPTVPSELHQTGSTAILTFLDTTSRNQALKICRRAARALHTGKKDAQILVWSSQLSKLGIERYEARKQLMVPDRRELLSSVEEFMTTYNELEQSQQKENMRKRTVVDEDGFITVTRGSKGVARREDVEAAEMTGAIKKRKNDGLEDFYRFQTRERRKEEQGELLKRFGRERDRVNEMRRARGAG